MKFVINGKPFDPTRTALVSALTQFDTRQRAKAADNPKRHYWNPYALGLYLKRIDEVMEDISKGATPRAACCAAFTGPVLRCALRAIKAEPPTKEELSGLGKGWTYKPASVSA